MGLAKVSKIIPEKERDKLLKARIREYGVDSVLQAIENVKNSDFLMGRTGGSRPFQATFDWFIRPNNFPKVLDGNYQNKRSENNGGRFSWAELAAQMEAEGKL